MDDLTEEEFYLWVAFIATIPEDTKSPLGIPLDAFRDFNWQEYVAAAGGVTSVGYTMKFAKQFGFSTFRDSAQDIIDIITNGERR